MSTAPPLLSQPHPVLHLASSAHNGGLADDDPCAPGCVGADLGALPDRRVCLGYRCVAMLMSVVWFGSRLVSIVRGSIDVICRSSRPKSTWPDRTRIGGHGT